MSIVTAVGSPIAECPRNVPHKSFSILFAEVRDGRNKINTTHNQTIEQWAATFATLPAPQSAERAIAHHILGDLLGYNSNSQYRIVDAANLENALIAYARLLQEHGVKV